MGSYFSSTNYEQFEQSVAAAIGTEFIKEGRFLELSGDRIFKIVPVEKPGWFDPEWFPLQPAPCIIMDGKLIVSNPIGFHGLFRHGQLVFAHDTHPHMKTSKRRK